MCNNMCQQPNFKAHQNYSTKKEQLSTVFLPNFRHLFVLLPPLPQLPKGSAVQQMAMRCWCLHFQSQDHSFLLQSNMFSNISKALAGPEEGENSDKKHKGDKVYYYYRVEPTKKGNPSMKGRLYC